MARCLDFLVIGAQKAGTTSVHKYLCEHPDLYLPPEKEAPFFSNDLEYSRGYTNYFDNYFRTSKLGDLVGTVTPSYMMNPSVPERIKSTCPRVKIIAILRDPIERAYSHYLMGIRGNNLSRTFEDTIIEQLNDTKLVTERNSTNYWNKQIVSGEYGRILKEYYKLFPKEQILILYMNDLISVPTAFVEEIFNFLGVKNIQIKNIGKLYHSSNINWFMSFISNIAFNKNIRPIGKYLFHGRINRIIRFYLTQYRTSGLKNVDSKFMLSHEIRFKLEELYYNDVRLLSELTGEIPYWVENWKNIKER